MLAGWNTRCNQLTSHATVWYHAGVKKKIIQTRQFSKTIDSLLKKRQLLRGDFDDFRRELAEHPEMGQRVVGTGGVRKARLKSSSRGKSGGFRVCYYGITQEGKIYLLLIYPKNVQDNLTMEEKKTLKELVRILRGNL